jgi:hypothetical protein
MSKKLTGTFPKFIHVTHQNIGTEDEYYEVAKGDAESALDSTNKTQVATYELKEVKEGRLEPVFSATIG